MAFSKKYCLFSAFIVLLCSTVPVFGALDEGKLINDIFRNYSRQELPNKAWNESVTVEFDISLINIVEVNEKENSITLMLWLTMIFNDYRLKWSPEEYGGIEKLSVPFGDIWLPDIVLYNGLSGAKITSDADAVVRNDGTVTAIPPMLTTAACPMDLTMFPYDRQTCSLKFASWTTSASQINLKKEDGSWGIKIRSYTENADWHLVNTSLVMNKIWYECCPGDPYDDITASLEIKRRAGPYTLKLVYPSVLTAFLILFSFLLPSSSGEIIVFCLLLFLACLLLLDNLQSALPNNSESVLGDFLTFTLFLDFFATVIAVIFYSIADCLRGGHVSKKERAERDRKLKLLRIGEFIFFLVFLFIFIIVTAVILTRRG